MVQANPAPTHALDWSLLDHDGLMTPVLVAHFGPLSVQVLRTEVSGAAAFRRISQLYQTATGTIILDAEMILNAAALPAQVLAGLQDSSIPFGQLVIEAGIAACSVDREITWLMSSLDSERRACRRHRLINARSGKELCAIVETLSPLSVLRTAQEAFGAKNLCHD